MEIAEKRGGHNRKKFHEEFFKQWSPSMAYVLGYAFADGTLIESQVARCCYLRFVSNDKSLLQQVKLVLGSEVKIQKRGVRKLISHNKIYWSKPSYVLSIGNKVLFQQLVQLGLKPDKSLDMQFPYVPQEYLSFFIRGYFDGDGCVSITNQGKRLQVAFTSGSKEFLTTLSQHLANISFVKKQNVVKSTRSYQLRFSTHEAMQVLAFMYEKLELALYLKRKYKIYQQWRDTQVVKGPVCKTVIRGFDSRSRLK